MKSQEYQAYLASREWALKREAVRKRSGNRCERCWRQKMDAVHHVTYERIGDERLSDLMAICDPCHEFLSGKREIDPMSDGVGVYLAGPFITPEWRLQLMGRSSINSIDLPEKYVKSLCEELVFPAAAAVLRGGFDCTGPWRIHDAHDEHGLISGHPGRGALGCQCCDRSAVVTVCRKTISRSDVVFCWLPERDSVSAGTLWELGFAAALGKPVVIARPEQPEEWDGDFNDDYWFLADAADRSLRAKTAGDAWDIFIKEVWSQCLRKHAG